MLDKIPFFRLLIYVLLAGLLPIIASLTYFISTYSNIITVKERIEHLRYSALLQEQRQASNRAVVAHYRDADHFYIDKHLETITLLEPEIESLQQVIQNKNFTGDDAIHKRLETLTSPSNRLSFTEGVVQSYPLFQETIETLSHPVELNVEDLKKLLTLIEGVTIAPYEPAPNRPQLIVLDFKIDKKNTTEKNEIFVLNLKLLKREFL